MTKKSQRGEIGGLCKNESECVTPDNLDENLKVSCKRRTFKKQSDGKYLKGKRRNGSCMLKKCCWTDQAEIPPKKSQCEGLTIMLHGEQEFVTQTDLQELIDSLVNISSSGSRSRSRSRSNSSSNSGKKKRTRKRVTFAARNNIIGSPQRRSSSNSSLISY